jgi:two-component system CheB/CheR fusion protein
VTETEYGALLRGPWKSAGWPTARSLAETLAERLVENMRGAVVVLDADLRVRLANRAFCQFFQVRLDEIDGRWLPELQAGRWITAPLRTSLEQVLAQGGQLQGVEVEHDSTTTGQRAMLVHAQRLAGAGGDGHHILLEIEDVTEHRALERQRQVFWALIAHELRNPVASIIGYAQLMRRRLGNNARDGASLGVIVDQARQVNRLIDDGLASSASASEHLRLEPRQMDLVALARRSIQDTKLVSPRHRFRLEIPDGPLEGHWDGGRLAQVFANLLGNAVKYSPAGGDISVRVEDLGPTVRVSIKDQGTGIEADALPRIFDQFYRAAANSDRLPGLGLGLHVTKMLVEAHGGSLSVQSVPGEGSTFSFTLPHRMPALADQGDRLLEPVR